MGVVGIIAPQNSSLIGLVSLLMPVLSGGNTAVILASENLPLCAITLAEVLHSSDVPGGVVNVLTGKTTEMDTTLAAHMDVNALVGEQQSLGRVQVESVENLKRLFSFDADWMNSNAQGLHFITDIQEVKTTWHPIENIGGASSSY